MFSKFARIFLHCRFHFTQFPKFYMEKPLCFARNGAIIVLFDDLRMQLALKEV